MVNMLTSTILEILKKRGIVSTSISIISMALIMLISTSATAAEIDVSVDRNPVSLSDSFQLTFSTTESTDDDPNFAPLKQDFDIINQQKSSQLSWVNGSTNKTIQWTLNVMAKRSGDLQIPAISFGNDTSKPLAITVVQMTPLTATSNDNALFLEVEATPTNAYVQAQISYTVRFYHRINLAQATLSDPKLDNAVVEKIAEDSQYNTQIKGMTYRVTERKYAIFPQQSGTMTIAPLVLTAEVITNDPRSRYNSFFSQQSTQTKRVLSKAINLNVQAAPANFNGKHWLPAEQLSLKDNWSNNALQVKVGEPITRTITITAKGATSSQLPDLSSQPLNAELKIYPDQPVINDEQNGNGVIAMRQQKIAFIPSSAGDFTLPAIDVPWFNTKTHQMETATLPAVTLVAIASQPANTTINSTPLAQETAIQPKQQLTDPAPNPMPSTASNTIWMWVAVGFGFAWLLTLIVFFWSRLAKTQTTPAKKKAEIKDTSPNLKKIIKELKTACTDNNPQVAQQALIKWATFSYNITSLAELNTYCGTGMQVELTKLTQALYAKDKLAWDGSGLLEVVMAKQTKKSSTTKINDPLVPLYPSQR